MGSSVAKKYGNSLSHSKILPRESSPLEIDENNISSITATSEPSSMEFIKADIPGAALDEPKVCPERLLVVFGSFALVAPVP